jgi:hypothetical protein
VWAWGTSYIAPVPRRIVPTCREFHGTSKKKVNSNKFKGLELITAPLLKLKEGKSFNSLKIQSNLATNNVYQKQTKCHEREAVGIYLGAKSQK